MKKYNINVNGTTYEVEVEEVGSTDTNSATTVAKSAPKAAPKAVSKAPKAAPKSVPAAAGDIAAPMPGTVIDIKVKEGQTVNSGEVVMILEAMKMENEIVAPAAGKISKIHVEKGAAVVTDQALITLG